MAEPSALPAPHARGPIPLIGRSDARLMRRAAAGDERAFAAIYERYHQELYRYCRAILRDPQDAQDALQNTMASALRSLPGESRAIELRPWLYRVAHNESVSLLRRQEPVAEDHDWLLPTGPGAEVEFEARERLRTLVGDMQALPERQRAALVMRELSGLSHDEIATALRISPGAARQVVYEARTALQELEEGRAMECEEVRHKISERDGRILRGRRVRAHLRSCEGCSDFRAAIGARRSDLQMLAPPLSAVAASGVLASLIGGSGSGAGALGGLFAGGVSGGALGAKTLGVIAASAAIGVGAGTVSGVDLPVVGGSDDPPASQAPARGGEDGNAAAARGEGSGGQAGGTTGSEAGAGNGHGPGASGAGKGNANGHGKAQSADGKANQANALGQAPGIPGHADGHAYGQGGGNGNAYGQGQGAGNAYGPAKQDSAPSGQSTVAPGKSDSEVTGPPVDATPGGVKEKAEKVDTRS